MLEQEPTAAPFLRERLASIVGEGHVTADPGIRALYSEDIWSRSGMRVDLVVTPDDLEQLAQVVAVTARAEALISVRGAGMSYTSAYIPVSPHTVSLDMSRMNRILSIDEDNMVVTVQPGCTWAELYKALRARGLRTPFWGPMSGLKSTIGGGLSNLNAMFGAARYGTTSESLVAVAVVLADGQILRTGARTAKGQPFYRHYGPDLAGLFAGDCGAFGIKGEISLRLMRTPPAEGFASFEFASGTDLLSAMAEISRAGVSCETCAFDPGLARVRMVRASMSEDVRTLKKVVAKETSLFGRLRTAARMGAAGRRFLDVTKYALHVICEGRVASAVDADLAETRRIVAARNGQEVESSIARIIRADPFPQLNSILGPKGERWAPVHGIVALADAVSLLDALQAALASLEAEFQAEQVTIGMLFTNLSTNALIIEPVFYWPEERFGIHEAAMEPTHLARLPKLAANPTATALVARTRQKLIEIFASHGCAHTQIGRAYPYRESRDPASWHVLERIKQTVDPTGRINPGVLGLAN